MEVFPSMPLEINYTQYIYKAHVEKKMGFEKYNFINLKHKLCIASIDVR